MVNFNQYPSCNDPFCGEALQNIAAKCRELSPRNSLLFSLLHQMLHHDCWFIEYLLGVKSTELICLFVLLRFSGPVNHKVMLSQSVTLPGCS